MKTLLCLVLGLERITFPLGGGYVSIVLPVVLGAFGILTVLGLVESDPVRTTIYLLSTVGIVGATLTSSLLGHALSTSSVALLLVAYLPFTARVPAEFRTTYTSLLQFFVQALFVLAILAIVQMGLQLLGIWHYTDIMAQFVPRKYLGGGYTISYPVRYGSTIYKSNAFFLLEPSICSQFMALGFVICIAQGNHWRRAAVFFIALLTTVSGTGLILLGAGCTIIAIQRGPKFLAATTAVATAAVALVLNTPLGAIYTTRAAAIGSSSSSGSQRFIAPYLRFWDQTTGPLTDLLFGHGAGYSDRMDAAIRAMTGDPALEPAQTKLIEEYGVVGGVPFLIFILFCLVRASRLTYLAALLLIAYLFLNASLLQTQTLYIPWILVTLFPRYDTSVIVSLKLDPKIQGPESLRQSKARGNADPSR